MRTVQNIYMVANPRSCGGYACEFLTQYPRENRCQIEVAVTRKAGAIQFVLPKNLSVEQINSTRVTLDCTLHLFNVLDPDERILCMNTIEKDLTGPGKENRDRYLGIMGGDGSLATTIQML